jgi:hypothetical protein
MVGLMKMAFKMETALQKAQIINKKYRLKDETLEC